MMDLKQQHIYLYTQCHSAPYLCSETHVLCLDVIDHESHRVISVP